MGFLPYHIDKESKESNKIKIVSFRKYLFYYMTSLLFGG